MKRIIIKYAIVLCMTSYLLYPHYTFAAQENGSTLVEDKIISSGDNDTSLNAPITRGEFVSLVNKTFSIYTTAAPQFVDVTKDNPYYYDFMAARYNGYLNGTGYNKVDPKANITKAEAAVVLSQLTNKKNPDTSVSISDINTAPTWAKAGIQKAVSLDLMQTDSAGKFLPLQVVTRAQAYETLERIAVDETNFYRKDEILRIPSFDQYPLTGRLSVPTNTDNVKKLVIYINGTGPNSYVNQRLTDDYRFNYFDFFSDPLTKQGTAFFSYSQRGITLGNEPPMYVQIDKEKYKTYVPTNATKDVKYLVDHFRNDPRFADAKIYLLGWSEGTIIAPHAVVDEDADVDGLILAGYVHKNLKDALEFQQMGSSSFLNLCIYFDCVGKAKITRDAFEANPNQIPTSITGTFDEIDANNDNVITVRDYELLLQPARDVFWNAYKNKDENYFLTKYGVAITTEWLDGHFAYGNNIDTLTKLEIPIYILHGTYDLNVPYQDALEAEKVFKSLGKDNLHVTILDKENHDLDFSTILVQKKFSKGWEKIFDILSP